VPERTLRELAEAWIEAMNARDLETLLGLAADDLVKIHPGLEAALASDPWASAPRSST
jgi:ketosteroid isomerase-like protein